MKDAGEKDGGRRGESERNKDRGEGGERRDKQKVVFSSEWEVRERRKNREGRRMRERGGSQTERNRLKVGMKRGRCESRWETREKRRREGGCADERGREREWGRDSGVKLSERGRWEEGGGRECEQSAKRINNQLTGITK